MGKQKQIYSNNGLHLYTHGAFLSAIHSVAYVLCMCVCVCLSDVMFQKNERLHSGRIQGQMCAMVLWCLF